MSKIRVHELAKELGRQNKEVLSFLAAKGIELKSHMSTVEDDQVEMVKKAFGRKTEAVKANIEKIKAEVGKEVAKENEQNLESAQTEAPKKKPNITQVFHPQNSRSGMIRLGSRPQGARQGARPAQPGAGSRPSQQGTAARPVQPGARPAQGSQAAGQGAEQRQAQQTAGARPAVRPETSVSQNPAAENRPAASSQNQAAGARPAASSQTSQNPSAGSHPAAGTQTAGPVSQGQNAGNQSSERPQARNQAPNRGADVRAQQNSHYAGSGSQNQRQGSQTGRPDNRGTQGTRPQGRYQDGRSQDNRSQDNRNQDSNRNQDNRGQGGRSYQDNRGQGVRRTDNRQGGRPGESRPDNRGQGGRSYQDNRGTGSRPGENRGPANRSGDNRGTGSRFGDNRGPANRSNDNRGRYGDSANRGQDNRDRKGPAIPAAPVDIKAGTKETRVRSRVERGDRNNDRDKFDRNVRQEKNVNRGNVKNNNAKGGKNNSKVQTQPVQQEKKEEEIKTIILPETMTIKELAERMKIQAAAIVKKLFLQGTMVTVNQEIDYATAEEIALEYNCIAEPEVKIDVIEELLKEDDEDEASMVSRPPVVCVMGHVDHGKTSLLDAIRHTHVIAKEAGGITQHIGAYVVEIDGQKITFLDTPGHEAFTAMRMRGANSTDIAILVVAADDGVMPQTVEAINHAKAAGIEIIVAINKIDKPSANVERVKQELSEYELVPEDWGGSTIFVPVSAHTHEGIDQLLEMILLTAEIGELKANPDRKARGLVIEAELDKGKGPVATVLVQKGTLHVGDPIAAGSCHGKVRAMMDDKGRRVKEAGPSTPVEILGLSDVPNAGEIFVATENEKEARSFAETFISQNKEKLLEETKAKMSLDDLFSQIQAGNLKELNIIVKADVQGSVEAVKQSLLKLTNEEVVVKVIHSGVGAINESDVILASASNAIIIGFNVRPDSAAKETAEREGVDVRLYRVIYDAIADVEAAMKGMLDPVYEEKILGHAEVRQTFKASGVGTIAGSYVLDGIFQRGCSVRITREGTQIFEGALASLKRFKDDVKEVRAGYECGLVFEKFNDIKEFDQVEAYTMVEVPR